MGKINYQKIYDTNKDEWKALTREPQKYEALLAGHYSESNHFVYELLQNAEDEGADRVVIEYYEDKLVFYHNGAPFDEKDVRGVSSMLMGTKDRNSAQTIGRFGMGFKSVFKYTYQPEIYSDDEAFRIENYLLPVEINNGWNYREARAELGYMLSSGGKYYPFREQEHLTKIVIPFLKRSDNGTLVKVSGREVLQKLQELNGEILLFLNHIKKLYWVNQVTKKFAMISLDVDQKDQNLVSCRIEGSAYGKREEITRYLKFKKVFDHKDMSAAEVSVAYRVNSRADNINDIPGGSVWVYFPTRDMNKLPFMIHGSFETAVSREKLMTPSAFNSDLFEKLGDLIAESLQDLKRRNLITQAFLRRVIIAAFRDEADNATIPGLKKKITSAFKTGALLPDRKGEYYGVQDLSVAVPFGIADFSECQLFRESLQKAKHFVALNNDREANFTEYFAWLTEELGVRTFTLAVWAGELKKLNVKGVSTRGALYTELEKLYDFLSDNRESLYTTKLSYSRSGKYEQTIRNMISEAWANLKQAPIILNGVEELIAPYQGDTAKVYLSATSDYQELVLSSVVHRTVAEKFGQLLKDGFALSNFDNFQYVKEKVIKKYIAGDRINFDNGQEYETEYIEDLTQILRLFEQNQNPAGVIELLKKASIIKIVTDDGTATFAKPGDTYVARSAEGIDLRIYYEYPPADWFNGSDDDYYYRSFEEMKMFAVDEEFYGEHGISIKKLHQFGVITSPVEDGTRYFSGYPGVESWRALGEYCPEISIDYLEDNLGIIEFAPKSDLARRKSAEILKLLIAIRQKLAGRLRKRKSNPYEVEDESRVLRRLKLYHSWLYNKNGELKKPREMSKHDLDTSLYGELISDKDFYAMLGFAETEDDSTADAFEQVDKLDTRNKKLLLKQLARELGMVVSDKTEDDEDDEFDGDEFSGDDVFDGGSYISEAFPIARVRNMDSLIEHVRQQFFCADPVTYRKVLRQIRTSKSKNADRAYVTGMYMNDSHVKICQMCKKASSQIYVTEIANFGIELPQMNLCLCPTCSGRYKALRDNSKDAFKEGIKVALCSLNVEDHSEEYEIQFGNDTSLFFTEIHIAEIQTILGLLSEYGIPNADQDDDQVEEALAGGSSAEEPVIEEEEVIIIEEETDEEIEIIDADVSATEDKQVEEAKAEEVKDTIPPASGLSFDFFASADPIQDGNLVSYKKMQTLEVVDAVIDSTKYPLHKAFLGKKVGDLVVNGGRRYLIISIL